MILFLCVNMFLWEIPLGLCLWSVGTEPPVYARLAFLFNCSTDIILQKDNLTGTKEDVKKAIEELPGIIEKMRQELLNKGDTDTKILANAIKELTESMKQFNLDNN